MSQNNTKDYFDTIVGTNNQAVDYFDTIVGINNQAPQKLDYFDSVLSTIQNTRKDVTGIGEQYATAFNTQLVQRQEEQAQRLSLIWKQQQLDNYKQGLINYYTSQGYTDGQIKKIAADFDVNAKAQDSHWYDLPVDTWYSLAAGATELAGNALSSVNQNWGEPLKDTAKAYRGALSDTAQMQEHLAEQQYQKDIANGMNEALATAKMYATNPRMAALKGVENALPQIGVALGTGGIGLGVVNSAAAAGDYRNTITEAYEKLAPEEAAKLSQVQERMSQGMTLEQAVADAKTDFSDNALGILRAAAIGALESVTPLAKFGKGVNQGVVKTLGKEIGIGAVQGAAEQANQNYGVGQIDGQTKLMDGVQRAAVEEAVFGLPAGALSAYDAYHNSNQQNKQHNNQEIDNLTQSQPTQETQQQTPVNQIDGAVLDNILANIKEVDEAKYQEYHDDLKNDIKDGLLAQRVAEGGEYGQLAQAYLDQTGQTSATQAQPENRIKIDFDPNINPDIERVIDLRQRMREWQTGKNVGDISDLLDTPMSFADQDAKRDFALERGFNEVKEIATKYGVDPYQKDALNQWINDYIAKREQSKLDVKASQTQPEINVDENRLNQYHSEIQTLLEEKRQGKLSEQDIISRYSDIAERFPEHHQLADELYRREQEDQEQQALYSRSPMKSIEANIARGRERMTKAILDKADVKRGMYNQEFGWVDFVWGDDGTTKPLNERGEPRGRGISHIFEARERKDKVDYQATTKMLVNNIVETIAKGNVATQTPKRLVLDYKGKNEPNGHRVILTKEKGSNAWILSGYEKFPVGGNSQLHDKTIPTQTLPTRSRQDLGATGIWNRDATGPGSYTTSATEINRSHSRDDSGAPNQQMNQSRGATTSDLRTTDPIRSRTSVGAVGTDNVQQSAPQSNTDPEIEQAKTLLRGILGDTLTEQIQFTQSKNIVDPNFKNQEDKRSSEGFTENGQATLVVDNITDGKVLNRSQRLAWVAWHELAHAGIEVKYGKTLENILNYARTNPVVDVIANRITKEYAQDGVELKRHEAAEEVIAELYSAAQTGNWAEIEDRYGLKIHHSWKRGDKSVLNHLSRIANMLRNLISTITGAELKNASTQDVLNVLRKVKRSVRELEKNAQSKANEDVRYSLNENADSEFTKAVDAVANGQITQQQIIDVGTTPDVLKMLGLPNVNVVISGAVLRKVMLDKHNITAETLKQLPREINNPVAVMKSSTKPNGYVVLTELTENVNGVYKPIISALHLKQSSQGLELINIASVYGRNNSQIQRGLENDLLYWNKEKGARFLDNLTLQLRSPLSENRSIESNIKTETDLSQYQAENLSDTRFSRSQSNLSESTYNQAKAEGKTELTFKQWKQVRSPEFKAWFGDWENDPENASKVINPKTGEPLVVYHGTDAEFYSFDIDKVSNTIHGLGHYFSDDRNVSKGYGDRVIDAHLDIKRILSSDEITLTRQELSQILNDDEILWNFGDISKGREKVLKNAIDELTNLNSDLEIVDYIADVSGSDTAVRAFGNLMSAGFKHSVPSGSEFYIPLNSNQIKSATDNNGDFDSGNDDIRFSRRPKSESFEKLRNAETIRISGKDIEPSSDLREYRRNAFEYGKTLRGSYVNKDTGREILLGRSGVTEVLHHDVSNPEHLQSIAAIPEIIEQSIYIDTLPNEDKEKNPDIQEYEYYLAGLNIGGTDYTVKAAIGIATTGDKYYDHKLTQIEKGDLLEMTSRLSSAEISNSSPLSEINDKRLLQLLQDEDVSDERNTRYSRKGKSDNDQKYLELAERYHNGDTSVENELREMVNQKAEEKGFGKPDYRMSHEAPNRYDEISKSLDDLTDLYPDDLYSSQGYHYYGSGDVNMDKKAWQILRRVKGNPEANITIYRAYPKGTGGTITNGDWVTIVRDYAVEHGEANINGDYEIVSKTVKAKDVFTNGDSLLEQGYDNGLSEVVNAKKKIKLDELITYDDNGEIIPLSQRFNSRKNDIRFSRRPKSESFEKLRNAETIRISGEDIEPSSDLREYKRNALNYGKTLRGTYVNKDTGREIALGVRGVKEVLQHDYKNPDHLQSIAAIPQIIENAVYIDTLPNEDLAKNVGIKEYDYYLAGLNIGGDDYVVRAAVGVAENGDRYYDHKLSDMKKDELLSYVQRITNPRPGKDNSSEKGELLSTAGITNPSFDNDSPLSAINDKRLLQLLQDENLSKNNIRYSIKQSVDDLAKSGKAEQEDSQLSKLKTFSGFKQLAQEVGGWLDERIADSLRPVNDWIDELGSTVISAHEAERLRGDMYRAKGVRDAFNSELEQAYLKPLIKQVAKIAKQHKLDELSAKRLVGYWISGRYAIEKNNMLLKREYQVMLEAEKALSEAKAKNNSDEIELAYRDYRKVERQYRYRKHDVELPLNSQDEFKIGTAGGWSNAEAANFMQNIEKHIPRKILEEVAELVYDLNQKRLDIDFKAGRYSEEQYNEFKTNRHYVPLTGDPNTDNDFDGISGAGQSAVNISKDRALKGRKLSEAEDGIDASWRAVGKTTTYAGWMDFKDRIDDIYETHLSEMLNKGYSERSARELTEKMLGISKSKMQGLTRSSDDVLIRKVGNMYYEYRLPIKAIKALKNDNVEHANKFLKILSTPTSWYARGVTQWTITFAPMNMLRDTWEKSEFIRVQKLYDKNGKQLDHKAMDKIGRGVLKNALHNKATWAAVKRFGLGQELRDSIPAEKALKTLLKNGGVSTYSTYLAKTETDLIKQVKNENSFLGKKLEQVGGVLESYNKIFDTVSALSAYQSLIENGIDEKQAAATTLELTNFRKTGSKMRGVKALYMFSQPTVMGARNLIKYLSTSHGQKRFVGYMAVMISLYSILRAFDDKDEGGNLMDQLGDITRYIPMPIGDGKYFKFPVGFGMPQMAWNFSVNMVKASVGDISFSEAATNMFVHSAKTFAPISPSEISAAKYPFEKMALTVTPTILQPLMQNVIDRSAFGSKITPNFVLQDKLKSEQSKSTTAQFWRDVALTLNDTLGIDMHPEQIKNLFDGYGSMLGSLKELQTVFVENPNREQLGRRTRTPFLNQFIGTTNEFAIQSRYYEASEEAQAFATRYKSQKERGVAEPLSSQEKRIIAWHELNEKRMKELRSEKAKATKALRKGTINQNTYEARLKIYNKQMDGLQRVLLKRWREMQGLNTN